MQNTVHRSWRCGQILHLALTSFCLTVLCIKYISVASYKTKERGMLRRSNQAFP